MMPSSSRLRSAGSGRLRARRRALLLGCALGSSLALVAHPDGAHAQAINGNPTTVNGVVTYSRITSPTPNVETITIETPSAIIDWAPPVGGPPTNPYIFLPAGNIVTFENGINTTDFAVLNRILTNVPSEFDGTVISRLNTASGPVPGGTVLFSSPGGIILGPTAVFDVGNLVLTTLNVEVNGAGQFISPNGSFQYEFNGGDDFPNAAIVLQPGSQIFANSENSFVALVAPRIDQGGSVRVNGSVAYIAGEDLGFSVNQGLFDIEVNVGTDNAIPIVHSGSTGGPASSAAGDNHRIYMVAVPKNQAITMLLSGSVGFDAAVSASVENGEIVLAGGQNIEEVSDPVVRFFDQAPGSQFDSNITIENGNFTSDVEARTLGALRLQAATGDLSFSGNVALLGTSSVDLFAGAANSLTIGGNLEGASYSNRNALAGTIGVRAESGGSIDVTGSTELRADPLNLFDTSDPPGFPEIPQAGDVAIVASGGSIFFGGDATFAAQGFSQSSTNSRGGTVSVLSEAGGQIDFGQGATLDATAQAGSNGLVAGNTNGGTAELVADGGSIDVGGNLLVVASVVGGGVGALSGGDGTGGTARLTSINGGDVAITGSASLSAGGIGGLFTGGDGTGGAVDVVVDGGLLDVGGALAISVLGLGADAAPGSSAAGGTGTGGAVNLRFASTSSTVDFLDIDAAGIGGSGAGGSGPGGDGGIGDGGNVDFVVEAGDLQVGVLNVSARGQGGAGGNGAEQSPGAIAAGGTGGEGRGGDAVVDIRSGGNLTLLTAVVDASGQGGVGGTGSASSLAGGTGGDGGVGIGGFAELGTSGGQFQALDPDGLAILAVGTGGDGGAGGGVDSAAGPGGNGGTGGAGTGGDARLVSSAGSITAGPAFLRADAVGGAGGAGGTSLASGGVGGTGGNAASGEARLDAFGGTITLGDVQVAVNAFGGAGGGGGGKGATTGAGGDGGDAVAGIDQTSFTRGAYVITEGGNLTVASASVQANGIGGAGGLGTTGGDGGDGSGGAAQFVSLGGTLQATGLVDLGADGVGAPGGLAVQTGPVGGAGGDGGDGVGGLSLISAEDDPSAIVIAPDVSLLARGLGGDGGAGAVGTSAGGNGGVGGDGTGGTAGILSEAGSITTGNALLAAYGQGGSGGAGGDSDPTAGVGGSGGAGGAGSGGSAGISGSANTIGSSVTLADVSLDASGLASAGGTGGSAAADGADGAAPATTGGQVRINSDVNPATGALASVTAGDVSMTAVGDAGSRIEIFARGAPLTMDSLTAFGRGVAFNETFASDATLRVNGDASIDVDADLYLYTVGTGVIDVGGTLQLVSTDSIVTGERPGGAATSTVIRTGAFDATAGAAFRGSNTSIDSADVIAIDAVGDVTLDNGTAVNGIDLVSATGSILSAGTLTADQLVANAALDILLGNVTVASDLDLATPNGRIAGNNFASDGDITLDAAGTVTLFAADSGGTIVIDSGGNLSLGRATADGDIDLASSDGSILSGAAGSDSVGSLDAGGDLLADAGVDILIGDAQAGGAIDLDAGRDIALRNADAGASFLARADGNAGFTGAVTAPSIAVISADIDVGAAGALGDANTQTVTLTVQPTTQQTVLGGGAEGPGYTLTEAEANRITADTLRIVAPVNGTSATRAPDVLVHDLVLSGQRLGVLELIAQGIMQVDGNLLLADVRADGGMDIRANQRLEILNPTGSIRVRDAAGLTDGNLSLTSIDIWSADQSILDQLRADPNFAGRDEALAANSGPTEPRGSIEAGDVTLSVGNSLFVQNTGTATVFAGITVRQNTLRIVPTGTTPLSVFAFGRRINPDGTFVTNNEFFSEVVFETRGAAPGYTDEAQFNLCFINSRACSRGGPDNPLPGGKDIIEEPVDPSINIGLAPGADDIVDTSFADEPLIEEPVTSGSDSILWDCDRDDDGDCDEDDTNG